MIHEDAAKKQQPAQHPRQGSSHEKSAAPQAPDAQQTAATHPPDMMQTAAANPARQSSNCPLKTKKQRLSPDMQQDREAQQRQQQQQQQAIQSGLTQSGISVQQQPCKLTEEHASHLNDTVGAVYVDAAGQTMLPRLCQPHVTCQSSFHVDQTSACDHHIICSRHTGILSQFLGVLMPLLVCLGSTHTMIYSHHDLLTLTP